MVTFRGMYYTSTNRLWVRNTSWKQEFHDLNSPLGRTIFTWRIKEQTTRLTPLFEHDDDEIPHLRFTRKNSVNSFRAGEVSRTSEQLPSGM
jgi:hypothetical protein